MIGCSSSRRSPGSGLRSWQSRSTVASSVGGRQSRTPGAEPRAPTRLPLVARNCGVHSFVGPAGLRDLNQRRGRRPGALTVHAWDGDGREPPSLTADRIVLRGVRRVCCSRGELVGDCVNAADQRSQGAHVARGLSARWALRCSGQRGRNTWHRSPCVVFSALAGIRVDNGDAGSRRFDRGGKRIRARAWHVSRHARVSRSRDGSQRASRSHNRLAEVWSSDPPRSAACGSDGGLLVFARGLSRRQT